MGRDRLIACIRIPNFIVQVESGRRPEIRKLPFAVTSGTSSATGVVIGCSDAAKISGVREGMSVRAVSSVCKEALLVPAAPEHYQAVHLQLLDELEEWVPAVEEGELGCAFTDITGMERLYPNTERLLQALTTALSRATHRFKVGAAAGPNKFVASIAALSAEAGTVTVSTHEAAAFLSSHPVQRLPVSEEMKRRLLLFGLQRLGQIARLHPDALVAQFGKEGRSAWELARGIDESALIPRRPFRPIVETLNLPAATLEWAPLWAGMQQLLARLWRRKERRDATVRQLELVARTAETRWEKCITFHEPVGELQRLEGMLKRRLRESALPGAVEALTGKLTLLGGAYVGQESLFAERSERITKIKAALARIKARYGTTGLYRIAEVEPWSRIPERRYALISFDP